MTVVVRLGGRPQVSWELPGSRFRRKPLPVIKGGRRTMYELAAAIAATGRRVELRGVLDAEPLEETCAAAGARPALDPAPRLPRPEDTIVFSEGWPHPLYAPYMLSGARCIMMLLAPPGFAGWPYTGEPWRKPEPLELDPDEVGRPEHFRAIAGLGCEMWTQSSGVQAAAQAAGTECLFIGSGSPIPFPDPVAKRSDVVVLEHNRWAPLALEVAERVGRSLRRVPRAEHETVLHELGSARVLVWPSRVEGHARVQVEARAMGTVPVALASNRFAQGLGEEGGAVLVESVEEMPAAIESLLDDPKRLERLSARARESARAQTDWDAYVSRVDEALRNLPSARDGAQARDRIYGELARGEYRLRARVAELEAGAAERVDGDRRRRPGLRGLSQAIRSRGRRPPGRGARSRDGAVAPPPEATSGEPVIYVAGGYMPRGGAYMAYHLGRVIAERTGWECRMVKMKGESPEHGVFSYPVAFEAVGRREMEARIAPRDLLVANPSFSGNSFGLRLPGRKLMYVQGLGSLPELDGFFDAYVCASDFLREMLQRMYAIEAPVIPPFIHVEGVPAGRPWAERPPGSALAVLKAGGEQLLGRLQDMMRSRHPEAALNLTVARGLAHDELLARMSESRYFLSLASREGFGLTPLEAMAAGCAVVGFHGGGGGQYMRSGENCEVVGYPALDALCERLAAVLADDAHAERLAAGGRAAARDYDLAAFEARWGEFLDGFLERAPAPARA